MINLGKIKPSSWWSAKLKTNIPYLTCRVCRTSPTEIIVLRLHVSRGQGLDVPASRWTFYKSNKYGASQADVVFRKKHKASRVFQPWRREIYDSAFVYAPQSICEVESGTSNHKFICPIVKTPSRLARGIEVFDASCSLPPSGDPSCGFRSSLAVFYKTLNDSKFKAGFRSLKKPTGEKLLELLASHQQCSKYRKRWAGSLSAWRFLPG